MTPRPLVPLVVLCGTIALTAWGAASLGGFVSSGIEISAVAPAVMSVGEAAAADADPTGSIPASLSAGSTTQPDPRMQLASLGPSKALEENSKPGVRPIDPADECLGVESCIDAYLWSLYERTPKVDTNKVTEKIKATVKKKDGKAKTIVKTVIKYVTGDFTWKDPAAAKKVDMPLQDYVIGGMDREFKLKLYHALRKMDAAGFKPGITSAFRDDYRQSIAAGNKAASDSSYHGGSRRGGYGRGLAADLVSVKGETRAERWLSTEVLWKWIDERGAAFGIGRPYLHKDPPHVGPID